MNINFEEKLLKISAVLGSNKVLRALSGGFMKVLPLTIIGSLFTLLANFPIKAWTDFISSNGIIDLLNIPPAVTVGFISVYVSLFIAYSLAVEEKVDGVSAALISLVSFLVVTPFGATVTSTSGEVINIGNVLSTQWLGGAGLFGAMIISIIATKMFAFIKKQNLTIKMPEGVPANIAKPFEALIPAFLIISVFVLIRFGFSQTSFGNMHSMVYSIIQQPMQGITANWLVVCLIGPLLFSTLWFFGIHAGQILIFPLLMPLLFPASLQNLAAYQVGAALPNIITSDMLFVGQSLGGVGNTIGLVIAMLLFAKSRRYKMLGKISILPSLFCINEPVVFGVPIVMNPLTIIPFVVAPIITSSLTYLSILIGIVPRMNGLQVPWTTPIGIYGFIQSGWQGALLQVVLVFISFLIYYPFFRVIDRQAVKDESVVVE